MIAQLAQPRIQFGPAHRVDAVAIAELLSRSRGDCLALTPREVLRRLREFEVARAPSGRIVGSAAVRVDQRAELRSVAVRDGWRGLGVGRALVLRAMQRARAAGQDLFCVSRSPCFFEGMGFERLPDAEVPQRVGVVPGGRPRRALVYRSRMDWEQCA